MKLKWRLLRWGVRLRQRVCTLCFGVYTPALSEEYTVLIRPYGSYIELEAPLIDERIPLSQNMDTLSKNWMTGVETLTHYVIECGLYKWLITLNIDRWNASILQWLLWIEYREHLCWPSIYTNWNYQLLRLLSLSVLNKQMITSP